LLWLRLDAILTRPFDRLWHKQTDRHIHSRWHK